MRWSTGRHGNPHPLKRPADGHLVPGFHDTWTIGWPAAHTRVAGSGPYALAVIGHCGADNDQLHHALDAVARHDWRALTLWPGSYLVLARHQNTLAVIGDLAGTHPVYWRTDPDGTWWATAAAPLAALHGAPIDTAALAAQLAIAQPDLLGERSLFSGIRRLPTGHALLIDNDGATTVRFEPDSYEPVTLAQAAPHVRAALAEAVDARLGHLPVSSDLAGLDSTTLACLAARRGPVTALTFADARLRDDDLRHATRTAAAVDNLHHHTVPGAPETVYYSPLTDLDALPLTDAPHAYTVTADIKHAVMDAAPAPGLHFTGSGGDGVLAAPPTYLADLLRNRRRRAAIAHAHGHARRRHTTALALLRLARPASRHTLHDARHHTARQLRQPPGEWAPQADKPVAWVPLLSTADWMTPDARAHLADTIDATTPAHDPRHMTDWTTRQDLARVGSDTTGWAALARTWHGIELAAPYLDNQVIRAALAVPPHERAAPDRYKPLLAEAFRHDTTIPDHVLSRTTKGGFNALAYAGLTTHADAIRDLLGPFSNLAEAGLTTQAPIDAMLTRAAAGQPTAQGALHTAVATEIWLRQLADTQTAQWWKEPAHVEAA